MTAAGPVQPAEARAAETWTAYTLRAGVFGSAVLMAVGYALSLLQEQPAQPARPSLVELSGLAAGADPAALVSLGLVVLIATSFVRVLVAAVLFARERDRALFLISAGVFAMLVASLWLGNVD